MSNLITILLVAVSFGILIIGHEFGHFIVAKMNGVLVEEFAIGMGPLLFKIKGKETMYSIRLLPIGGYVKMLGEYEDSDEEVDRTSQERAYIYKSPLRKISIILAGPIMNFVLAFFIFWGISTFSGYTDTVIREVVAGSPAETAGLKNGDKLISVNSKKFLNWNEFVFKLQTVENKEKINIGVIRDSQKINFDVFPNIENNSLIIGIKPQIIEKPGFFEGVANGFRQTVSEIKQVISSLGQLITGKASVKDLSGPITIFKVSGQAAKAGIQQLLNFTAFLSVNLGIFNLIPFPALDGGAFVINLVELVSKKRIKQEILAKINFVGFTLLILLMIFVTLKDILFPVAL